MTYTLVFRVTREVWDAMQKGEKTVEYRDCKPFWNVRMEMALYELPPSYPGKSNIKALFLCGSRKARYNVRAIRRIFAEQVPAPWDKYVNTEKVWAVELGERIGEELARRMEG